MKSHPDTEVLSRALSLARDILLADPRYLGTAQGRALAKAVVTALDEFAGCPRCHETHGSTLGVADLCDDCAREAEREEHGVDAETDRETEAAPCDFRTRVMGRLVSCTLTKDHAGDHEQPLDEERGS